MTHMIELTLNDRRLNSASEDALDASLNAAFAEPEFELWASIPGGPAMCMLRNGADAWLMYLRGPGDAGFRSVGIEQAGSATYTLTNGQADEFPRAWCIELESCREALRSFCRHNGTRPDSIAWAVS
jgi:hypothetical protein